MHPTAEICRESNKNRIFISRTTLLDKRGSFRPLAACHDRKETVQASQRVKLPFLRVCFQSMLTELSEDSCSNPVTVQHNPCNDKVPAVQFCFKSFGTVSFARKHDKQVLEFAREKYFRV